jgi:aconitate hydratase
LGVRAVIAESYERIHRSNLVGMGVLPLEFKPGDIAASLGLSGHESFTIAGVSKLAPRSRLRVEARDDHGASKAFDVVARADTPEEVAYYRHGGILPYVLRQMLQSA